MDFRIQALPLADFAPLFGLADDELAARGVVRRIADRRPGFPCRVSLRDAVPGEAVLLLNYQHLPAPGPYESRHAIYVREAARDCTPDINEIPEMLASRLLSVRAFDGAQMLLDSEVIEGAVAAPLFRRFLANPAVECLHLHSARPGCYEARVVRA